MVSSAPSNTTDNIIVLKSIIYQSGGIDTPIPFSQIPIIFTPLFTASTTSPDTPIAGTPNTFKTAVIRNSVTSIVPTIITTLRIGSGSSISEWKSLTSIPMEICTRYPRTAGTNNLCDWTNGDISIIATSKNTDFVFTGTYTTGALFTLLEPTTIGTYIYYNNGSTDILYPLPDKIINDPTLTSPRLRVLGQASNGL